MPELPEVETVRRSLLPAVVGTTITGLRIGNFPGVLGGDAAGDVAARVVGRRIDDIDRRGKYLIVRLDDGSALTIHLRMTGSLLLLPRGAAPVRFEHLALDLDSGFDLRFADQRKFGRVIHTPPGFKLPLARRLGPEPLSRRFTASELGRRLSKRAGAIKSVLLDQGLVAGLGNIYVDEALFRARIHPLRQALDLSPAEVCRLHRAIRAVLREGLLNRGTTFSSFQDGYGNQGGNQRFLRVYGRGRRGEPCPRCGEPLAAIVVGGRGTHYCPQCQPAPVTGSSPIARPPIEQE